MDLLFTILYWINMVAVGIVTISFIPQFLFLIFSFLPRRHWKDAKENHKLAVIIPAHNEGSVIYKTVYRLLNEMDYPKELYKVYVICHNCTDNTEKEVLRAGGIPLVYSDSDPAHATAAHALLYGYNKVLEIDKEAELFVKLDGDNYAHADFLKEMNKSFDAGAKLIRGYEASTNLQQNIWTEQCSIFYTKDSRLQNTFRQNVHGCAMLSGPGLSASRDIVERIGGWDAMSKCDDAEFTLDRLFEGYKTYFNTDAIVYEDQPSSFADTYNRLIRLGHSLNKLFFTDGWKMIVMFFRTLNPMYLDMLLQIAFNPVSVICFVWFPLYYIFYAICMILQWSGVPVFTMDYAIAVGLADSLGSMAYKTEGLFGYFFSFTQGLNDLQIIGYYAMTDLFIMAVQVIIMMCLFCIIQSWVAVFLDRRKLGMDWKLKGMWKGILLSPIFSFVYGICNCIGAVSKPRWIIAKRNPQAFKIMEPLPEKTKKKYYFEISEREKRRYSGKLWQKKKKVQ